MATFYGIPTVSDGSEYHYVQKTALDSVTYQLRFIWNTRTGMWTFFLETAEGDPIYGGRPVVPLIDLLQRCVAINRPPGKIACLPQGVKVDTVGLEDLGTKYKLFYITDD